MSKYTGGKAWLDVLVLKQNGKAISGVPTPGKYTIELKPGQSFAGSRKAVVADLSAEFKGCEFTWA